ncbi:MAG: ABC-F family ATP-binding cassette domain-containing protein [Candidatus Spechtbacterales bacterium]
MKIMAWGEAILKFDGVSFEFGPNKPVLNEVSFAVRRGAKITLMGQNGAGKSTIFKLITGECEPTDGRVITPSGLTIATSKQVMAREYMDHTVREYFESCFDKKVYDIDPRIDAALDIVNLKADHDKLISSFSGGQQARLLLTSALIQDPDLLLLDEPTNNLDVAGIAHLTEFLKTYKKTCIVISHDADFLNSFTEGVIYLDVNTKKIEQYTGDYSNVVREIAARVEKERHKNAQLAKQIQANKEKANYFAHKGGNLRLLAKRMRETAQEAQESMVDVRKEDKAIRPFTIPIQQGLGGVILSLNSVTIMRGDKPVNKNVAIELRKDSHLLLKGPNGIGKTTLLESIAKGTQAGEAIGDGVRVGYYRQDFSTLNFEETPHTALMNAMDEKDGQKLRAVASGFLIGQDIINTPIGALSEGQKGLVAFAQLVLMEPGLLILDEPTNHINFRHLPIIAKALDEYRGAMILVSHMDDFVRQIRMDELLDLGK